MKKLFFMFTFLFAVSSVAFVSAAECADTEKEETDKESCRRRRRC